MEIDEKLRWSVAIFASREDESTLLTTVESVCRSAKTVETTIDVLVNGNSSLATQVVASLKRAPWILSDMHRVRVWSTPVADKAAVWNSYIYEVLEQPHLVFFIDGYVQVLPDALERISAFMRESPHSLAATGVPTSGPSANALRKQMLRHGGIHGNLYAIRGTIVEALRKKEFRLPLGIYRTDSLIGAAICFNLDPANNHWDIQRIAVLSDVSWRVHSKHWWRWEDINGLVKRKLRQAQGILENRAVRTHLSIKRRPVGTLSHSTKDLVSGWRRENPKDFYTIILKHPLTLYAFYKLARSDSYPVTMEGLKLVSNLKNQKPELSQMRGEQ